MMLGGAVKTLLVPCCAASITFCTEPWLSSTVAESLPPLAALSASPICTVIR
jgi:hypothetical protein